MTAALDFAMFPGDQLGSDVFRGGFGPVGDRSIGVEGAGRSIALGRTVLYGSLLSALTDEEWNGPASVVDGGRGHARTWRG